MAAKTPQETPAPKAAREPASETGDSPLPLEDTAHDGQGAGAYEYTHPTDCVYPHVPLTAHAADPGRAADGNNPGRPATVYDWPSGPPADGRWTKTRKKPNQQPDNAPVEPSEE